MNKEINRYQANVLANVLLFMIVTTGLFALAVHWPDARNHNGIRGHQRIGQSFSSDFKFGGTKAVTGNRDQ